MSCPRPSGTPTAAYLAPRGFLEHLLDELAHRGLSETLHAVDRLVITDSAAPPTDVAWAEDVWLEPVLLPAASIGEAAKALVAIQRNWACFSVMEHRRAALIQQKLPRVKPRLQVFGDPPPASPLGGWTLLERELILASARRRSPFPHGAFQFEEDKTGPPNRAYLKLWEALTLMGHRPGPGDCCLDLGASPGGWTWVLAQCGAQVTAVDRTALVPELMRHPRVRFVEGSAFGVDPRRVAAELGAPTWLVWDVACYPERLRGYVERWLEHGPPCVMVCTVKLQGPPTPASHAALDWFRTTPRSRLIHLHHNRHELTWIHLPALAGQTEQAEQAEPLPALAF